MIKRRVKNESMDNMNAVMNNDSTDAVASIPVVMADAYIDNDKSTKHLQGVKKELEDRASDIIEDAENSKKNDPLNKLVLDESVEEFNIETTNIIPFCNKNYDMNEALDGRSDRVIEDGDDEHLDFDMFDFIMGLVSDTWPKPKSPLGHPLRKFQTQGQDDYIKTEENAGVPQVASDGVDTIIVYANETEAFDDIKEVCRIYKFKCDGPHAKRSPASHWNFSFNIKVPLTSKSYPQDVEDYFTKIGYTIEDVMPADWAKVYRKKMDRIQKEAQKMLNELTVKNILETAVRKASRDSEPLEQHLKNLYTELDNAKCEYTKKDIKQRFMSEFDDDFEDEE